MNVKEETAMSADAHKKSGPPQIVRLENALKLAEQWVSNMSKIVEDESNEAEPEGRPLRLGLGAKVVRQSKVSYSNDPVERKLLAKLEAGKRKAATLAESNPSVGDGQDDDNEVDEELESRTSIFSKNRAASATPSLHVNKKHK